MPARWFGCALSILLLTSNLHAQPGETLLKALGEGGQWSPRGEALLYDESTLPEVAGELSPSILAYGFRGAAAQNWSGPAGGIRVTLYEMIDTSAAYGLFSLDRDFRRAGYTTRPLGAEGYRIANQTRFWQSEYVVEVRGAPEAADAFGRAIAERILGLSRKPPVSNHLPLNHLVSGSEKYLLHPETLDSRLELDPATLGFEDSAEMATATYQVDGRQAQLILLLYPTQQMAKMYVDQWNAAEPQNPAFLKRASALVGIVRGTTDESVAKTILDDVGYETKVTWNEAEPDGAFADMMLTIFSLAGFALLLTLIAGIGFGGLRVAVKALFPNKVFDRPQDVEVIQLNLIQEVTRKELRD